MTSSDAEMQLTNGYFDPIDFFDDLWWVFLQHGKRIDDCMPLFAALSTIGFELIGENSDTSPRSEMSLSDGNNRMDVIVTDEDNGLQQILVGIRSDAVIPPESSSARLNADRFLECGKICYSLLHPFYAFAENVEIDAHLDALESGHLTYICWAQFFDPSVVERVGREVLCRAPAWRNENLQDGGLLYVLSASPFLYRGPQQYWGAARGYFDQRLPTPVQWADMPG